jgi:hypothetical protein
MWYTKGSNPLPKQPLPQANTFPPHYRELMCEEGGRGRGRVCVLDLRSFGA